MGKWSIISMLKGVYVKLKRRMMAYRMVSSFRPTRLFVLTVIVPLIAIIIFIMFDSPNSIQSRFNPESQWIPFYASYLGGIFGGIISGGLTLGGVYLTIRHQNKLLNKEKAAKMSYICRKMENELKILDKLIEDTNEFSDSGLLHEVERCAKRLLGVIADNTKYINDALGIMYIPMNVGLLHAEREKAPFLGLSSHLIVMEISKGCV